MPLPLLRLAKGLQLTKNRDAYTINNHYKG